MFFSLETLGLLGSYLLKQRKKKTNSSLPGWCSQCGLCLLELPDPLDQQPLTYITDQFQHCWLEHPGIFLIFIFTADTFTDVPIFPHVAHIHPDPRFPLLITTLFYENLSFAFLKKYCCKPPPYHHHQPQGLEEGAGWGKSTGGRTEG